MSYEDRRRAGGKRGRAIGQPAPERAAADRDFRLTALGINGIITDRIKIVEMPRRDPSRGLCPTERRHIS